MIRSNHLFAMSSLGDKTVTAVTIVENCHSALSPSRARMCDIKNLTPTRRESSSKSVTNSHHVVTTSLSHIREKSLVTNFQRRLPQFKRSLKRGPKLGRKELALFVVDEAAKHGLLYATQRAQ